MKVVLLKNLEGTGNRGSIVEVLDGYAMNYLIPHKFAVLATTSMVSKIAQDHEKKKKAQDERISSYAVLVKKINKARVTLDVAANTSGHLYGAVHGDEIAEALRRQGLDVENSNIELPKPIDSTGDHRVHVRFDGNNACVIIVSIVNRSNG